MRQDQRHLMLHIRAFPPCLSLARVSQHPIKEQGDSFGMVVRSSSRDDLESMRIPGRSLGLPGSSVCLGNPQNDYCIAKQAFTYTSREMTTGTARKVKARCSSGSIILPGISVSTIDTLELQDSLGGTPQLIHNHICHLVSHKSAIFLSFHLVFRC